MDLSAILVAVLVGVLGALFHVVLPRERAAHAAGGRRRLTVTGLLEAMWVVLGVLAIAFSAALLARGHAPPFALLVLGPMLTLVPVWTRVFGRR
jgi:hypothetical protein